MAIRPFLVGAFLLISLTAFTQSLTLGEMNCEQKLDRADEEFSAGHFYAIPSILGKCLEDNEYNSDQKVRAYLLLCQAYMILDDPIAAGDSYLKLLKADPEFVPNAEDHPIDVVYLSKQYTATPIFTPHFRLGLNGSIYRQIYSLSTEPYSSTSGNPFRVGFQVGGGLDWNYNDNFSLCVEANLSNRGFFRNIFYSGNNDETSIQSTQWWLDFPVYVKYSFVLNEQFRPFFYAGAAANLLLSASGQFTYTDNKPNGAQIVSEGPPETTTNQQNTLSKSWLIGGGVRYKIGRNYLFADLRYMAGLSNLADTKNIYYQDKASVDPLQVGDPNYHLAENITRYHYLSDYFRLDNVSLSFGFVRPLYNPRKVKKARTKSVAKTIRKESKKGGKKN